MVRLRRNILGMSQTDLGKALGVAFQQVQKYEKGTNRIGASRLYRLSQILKVPVNYFFDDLSTAKVSPTRVFDADLLWPSAKPPDSGVGRGNRRRGEKCGRGTPGWRKIWENGRPGTANSPKSGYRTAAEGIPLQRRRNLSMIAMDLKAIWEMSDKTSKVNPDEVDSNE